MSFFTPELQQTPPKTQKVSHSHPFLYSRPLIPLTTDQAPNVSLFTNFALALGGLDSGTWEPRDAWGVIGSADWDGTGREGNGQVKVRKG
ncbi:hypothetical protein E2C01_097637 [Portunus trituberculatus]|uniref:Uncharacterized protein n=1 Tax=Portunus trituberculatus TaxID=210409 RepID=A0A5B7KAH9_PORTR|nr:hypothetical protein [Portunus trituberculatus]